MKCPICNKEIKEGYSKCTLKLKILEDEARLEVFKIIRYNPGHSGTSLINVIKEELKKELQP